MTDKPIHDLSDEEVDREISERQGWTFITSMGRILIYSQDTVLQGDYPLEALQLAEEQVIPHATTTGNHFVELVTHWLNSEPDRWLRHNKSVVSPRFFCKAGTSVAPALTKQETGDTWPSAVCRAILAAMRAEAAITDGGNERE